MTQEPSKKEFILDQEVGNQKNKNMKEQLISYKTALLAKEKGFDVPVLYGTYGKKMKLCRESDYSHINWNAKEKQQDHSRATSIPTQSLIQK